MTHWGNSFPGNETFTSTPAAEGGEWVEWTGGDNAPEGLVGHFDARLRSGEVYEHLSAGIIPPVSWKHVFGVADIVAYRVVKP